MTLERSSALCFATLIDDAVNKLGVLGKILPVQIPVDHPDACEVVNRDIEHVIKDQTTTEGAIEAVLSSRAAQLKEKVLIAELHDLMQASIRGTEQVMKQSPLLKENFEKLQQDRAFAENVLLKTQLELVDKNEFTVLTDAVNDENQDKLTNQGQIIREEHSRYRVKQLYFELATEKKEKEAQVQHCDEIIAHLKDQLQEMKAKSNMEAKYVKKSAENYVGQGRRICRITEETKAEDLVELKKKIDIEERSHQECTKYLKKHLAILEEKVDFWMDKYDADTEAKQYELDLLIANKAHDLERLHELMIRYSEYEKVLIHDRIEKEKARRKLEQDQLEVNSAVTIQTFWRAYMTVHKIGPCKGKKKKGKKK